MNALKRLWKEEEGQAMSEYGLIIGLIAVVVIGAVTLVGGNLNKVFTFIAGKFTTVSGVSTTTPTP
ncbi:Flp family type IVb pilin [Neobacillus sp. SAB-20_R2A]|uniref:Flp family type IVb pilin n=1 Tax=Neobacillus sp. SAB-20_R2A TaxID=3120519 RepID=UPI003C6E0548